MCNDGEIRAVDLVLSRYLRSVIINFRTFDYEIFLQNLAVRTRSYVLLHKIITSNRDIKASYVSM